MGAVMSNIQVEVLTKLFKEQAVFMKWVADEAIALMRVEKDNLDLNLKLRSARECLRLGGGDKGC